MKTSGKKNFDHQRLRVGAGRFKDCKKTWIVSKGEKSNTLAVEERDRVAVNCEPTPWVILN